jgi:hypothetical protein
METPFGVWLPQVTILRSRRLSDAQNAVEAIRQRHCVLLQVDDADPVTASKDDAPAAVQAAIHNVAGLGSSSIGGGLIQTTSG